MRKLVTLAVFLITIGVFTTPVKADGVIKANEWVTLTDEDMHLFSFYAEGTGYHFIEYESNNLFEAEFTIIHNGMKRRTEFIDTNISRGTLYNVNMVEGTRLDFYFSIEPKDSSSYFKFRWKSITDERYPKPLDDISFSAELDTEISRSTIGYDTYETFKYNVKENGVVDVSFNWVDGYEAGALDNNNDNNYIAIVSNGILVDILSPITEEKNKLETYLKKGTYYFVVRLSEKNKENLKYNLSAKNKKDDTVEHELNNLSGVKHKYATQELKLNKELKGKISFSGLHTVQFKQLSDRFIIASRKRKFDNDTFCFKAPKTATYTFITTPINSKIGVLNSSVWLDIDKNKYIKSKKKGKSLVASVKLKKGQKIYLNIYNTLVGQQYKVKVK